MKKLIFTFVIAMTVISLHAQIQLIAVKGATTNTVVETIEQAIATAQPGDKIYLPGGAYYMDDTLKKQVHIIGSGYDAHITRATLTTSIMGNLYIGSTAKKTIIEGVAINNLGNFHILADSVLLRRCKIAKHIDFKNSKGGQLVNCITHRVYGNRISVCNSLLAEQFHADTANVSNSIIKYIYQANGSMFENCIYGAIYGSYSNFNACYQNPNAIYYNSSTELAKIFKNNPTNDFFNLENNYQLTDSLTNLYPNLGIYKVLFPWKDGGQPINPYVKENDSYLDVQDQKFKLRVKVEAQSY